MPVRLSLVAVLLFSVACGRETSTTTDTSSASTQTTASSSPAPAPPAAPTKRDVCAMLSADELKSAAGMNGADQGKPSTSGGADVCTWFSSDGKGLVVQVFPYSSSYESARSAFEGLYETKSSELSGVGEKAYFLSGKTGPMATATLVAAKGQTPISVQVMGGSGNDESRKTEATNVANVLLGKL